MPEYQVESVYTQLFEFISSFHNNHTTFGELHRHINPSSWDAEARLIDSFRNDFVIYNGVEVPRWWPTEVMKWQTATLMELHGTQYEALPYGVEPGWEVNADLNPMPRLWSSQGHVPHGGMRRGDVPSVLRAAHHVRVPLE